jgi:hypothetical protein
MAVSWHRVLLGGIVFGVPSRFGVGGGGHPDVLQGSRLVLVAVEVQRAHGCLRACVITQCEVVISVKDS